jgi:uncharacterized membrane protein YjfL (UPF0719 family)
VSTGAAPATPQPADPSVPVPRNVARALARTGGLIGAALLAGTVKDGAILEAGLEAGGSGGVKWMVLFGVVGVGLLMLTTGLANLIFLRGRLRAEIARGNVAAGLISAGHSVAMGLILGGCFYGRDLHALSVSAVFFLIGVGTLLGLQRLYRLLTHYADDQETLGANSAAAVGFVGVTLAFAIIVAHAADGQFVGWSASLRAYGVALLLALALFPVRQLVVGPLLLGLSARVRGGGLDRLVGQERDVVVAVIEAAAYVAAALLATGVG